MKFTKINSGKPLSTILCGLLIAVLTACGVHSVNEEPHPSVNPPESYSSAPENISENVVAAPWWKSFDRPSLDALIKRAFQENQNVAQSLAVLKQVQAVTRQTKAGRLPQVGLEGNIRKEWEGSDEQPSTREFGGALDWEIDIFNRIGAAARADEYESLARTEDVEAVKLGLSAEMANAYFGAASAQQRIELLKEQLKLDQDLEDLLQLRLDNGVGTNVDVLQQQARVADSETLIPLAQADRAVFENRIDVLLGAVPDGKYRVPLNETLDFASEMAPIGVPAYLLLNRPDLRVAQAELIAADSDIASAIADRLPRITLSGSYVYSDTATYTGPLAALIGGFVQPLLDWGQRKAEVERNKALYEERLAAFTQLYLEAVEDVENALIREKKQREFLERLQRRKNILQQTVDISENRYSQGIDDYLPVINALQELRQVERDLISERLELLNIRIELYRAIGGPIRSMNREDKDQDEKSG